MDVSLRATRPRNAILVADISLRHRVRQGPIGRRSVSAEKRISDPTRARSTSSAAPIPTSPREALVDRPHRPGKDVEVVAAEPADVALDTAYIVDALDSGLAVMRARTPGGSGTWSTVRSRSGPGRT